ncbi:hypothetical protein MAM1_0250c08733 [Mucor ambiguus]|uniref:F-box/LRR-repeat protein 15-like leucin rich repeat domain-containing protein n=1 Tax=Mucor ambiguus TaxID=91626 RepID=A0A0C9MEX3_9FUNG|nr:hypothetical protein MAM1_0250c08733 [Mucor ambiguus]
MTKTQHQQQIALRPHLALRLPEILNHILSYLIAPYQSDDSNKAKTYQHIHACLAVNVLWHDCATRLIWRHITFDDSKSELEAFLKFASALTNHSKPSFTQPMDLSANSLAAGLAIAAPKPSSVMSLLTDRRLNLLKPTKADRTQHYINLQTRAMDGFEMNQDPVFLNYDHMPQQQRNTRSQTSHYRQQQQQTQQLYQSALAHQHQYRNAVRSITLRKIKDKSINEPLQQIGQHTHKLEKLDIYICDYLSDSSIYTFITHNNQALTYLSLAGCNKITDDAVLSVAQHCPKLEHLDLRACGLISDVSIQSIAKNCPNLHHLNVGRVRDREKITMKSINLIAQKTKVAVLGLAGCDITDECLILLAKCRGRGLERISVNNCYRITNKSVRAYVDYCPNLSVFEMKECHWVDDWAAVAELVQRKVLLTLCEQQNRACADWARRSGRIMEVKAPVK